MVSVGIVCCGVIALFSCRGLLGLGGLLRGERSLSFRYCQGSHAFSYGYSQSPGDSFFQKENLSGEGDSFFVFLCCAHELLVSVVSLMSLKCHFSLLCQ